MKQATETTKLFQQVLETTPKEIAQQVEWSYTIADKIDEIGRASCRERV